MILNKHVLVRHRDIDPARFQFFSVHCGFGRQWSNSVEDFRQDAGRAGGHVQYHQYRAGKVRGEPCGQLREGLHSSGGGTNGYQAARSITPVFRRLSHPCRLPSKSPGNVFAAATFETLVYDVTRFHITPLISNCPACGGKSGYSPV